MKLNKMGLLPLTAQEQTTINGGSGRCGHSGWQNFWTSYRNRYGCNHHTYEPPTCTPPPCGTPVDPPPVDPGTIIV